MSESNYIISGEEAEQLNATNLGEHLLKQAESHGNKPALIDGVTREVISFPQLIDNVKCLAIVFNDLGLKTGDLLGLCSENSILYHQILLAALAQGIALTTFNSDYTDRELEHCLKLSKPKIVLTTLYAKKKVDKIVKKCKFVKQVVLVTSEKKNVTTLWSLKDRVKPIRIQNYKCAPLHGEEISLVLYSSGTTGLPKGVMLSHRNILSYIAAQRHPVNHYEFDHTLGYLPMYHAYGLIFGLYGVEKGFTSVVLPKFIPDLFLKCLQDFKITSLTAVPPIVNFLAKHPIVSKFDLSNLRFVFCGAAPMSKELEDLLIQRHPYLEFVRQGYGMTESTLGILSGRRELYKPGSTGVVMPGQQVKVVDLETGQVLGPNKTGEICIRGPMVMKGYLGDEKATRSTIDSDGWLHSGDVGYYDDDRWFFIVDRVKELIKFKGYQVAPAELEALLLSHPAVADAAVIGIPDDEAGELPKAFVVKQAPVTEEELLVFIANQVTHTKRLRGGIEFVQLIPKSPSGKILRRELRERVKKSKL